MDAPDKLIIDTPEQTALEFPLAGIGSRFVGVLADTAIQALAGFVLFIVLGILFAATQFLSKVGPQWIIALYIFAVFLLNSSYYAFFETIWNGQTPGKRLAKLRVMKDDGRPIRAYDAILRNLLRIVDSLPGFYGIGVISVWLSKQNKRLGDLVAGTVVVHERTMEGIRPVGEMQVDESLPPFEVTNLTLEEMRVIETFIQRCDSWDPGVRTSMAAQLALRIGDKVGIRVYGWPRTENFLQAVLQKWRSGGHLQP